MNTNPANANQPTGQSPDGGAASAADEAREKRLTAERAARERAIQAEQAARQRRVAEEAQDEKKDTVRRAVRNIHRDAEPDLALADRENLLDDPFRDYEDHFDYEGEPAEIVAQLCRELGLVWIPGEEEDDPNWPSDGACLAPRGGSGDGALRLARDYLNALRPPRAPPKRTARNGHDPP